MLNIPVYECPVDGCGWVLSQEAYERQRPPIRADGAPQVGQWLKAILRQHLETHDVFEWVDTVLRLNQELAQQHSGIRPHVYREQR
jgi:hypothetical protein